MGKRRQKKRVVKKTKRTVAKVFDCLFCNHIASCECKLDKDPTKMIGTIVCRVCETSWNMKINILSDPIDVYSAWVDRCEEAAKAAPARKRGAVSREDERVPVPVERKAEQPHPEDAEEEAEESDGGPVVDDEQ